MCATKPLSALLVFAVAMSSFVSCAAQERSYTIAGDVASPDNYSFPTGEQVNLLTLLEKADAAGSRGSAVIVRGPSLQVMSTNTNQPSPMRLVPGDIVIFESVYQDYRGVANAVVVHDGIAHVIPLEQNSLTLASVLASLGLTTSQPATGIRPEWSKVELSTSFGEQDIVNHGDVICLSNSAQPSGYRSTETFSDFAIPVQQASVAAEHNLDSDGPILDPVSPASSGLIVPPVSQSVTLYVPDAGSSPPESTVYTEDEAAAPALNNIVDEQMELREPESQSTPLASGADTPFRTASLQNRFGESETISLEDSYQPATNTASNNVLWNGVFIAGLVFAMGLIVVGWLKTRHEREMEARSAESIQMPSVSEDVVVSEQIAISEAESLSTESPEVTDAIVAEAADLSDSNTAIAEDCPILSAGLEAADEMDANEAEDWQEKLDVSLGNIPASEQKASEPIAAEAWFSADLQHPDPEVAEPSVVEHRSDQLEDLIQNRLPMELQQAELPLKIALFGKPTGPQRLRIDAAHTQIAAPHMASKARRSQRKQPAVATESNAGGRGQKTNSTERSSQDSPPTSHDRSRFDRALNFIEEQSDK